MWGDGGWGAVVLVVLVVASVGVGSGLLGDTAPRGAAASQHDPGSQGESPAASVQPAGVTEDWARSYEYGQFTAMERAPDDGYVFYGQHAPANKTTGDLLVLKTDSDGEERWNATFGGDEVEFMYGGAAGVDGGYVVSGASRSFGDDAETWIVGVAEDGEIEWQHRFDDTDWGGPVVRYGDGGYVVGAGDTVFMLGSEGTVEWRKRLEFAVDGDIRSSAAIETSDGHVVVAGSSLGSPEDARGWLVELDGQGDVVWKRTFDQRDRNRFDDVVETSRGYLAVGHATADPHADDSENDAWIVSVTADGEDARKTTYGVDGRSQPGGYEFFTAVTDTPLQDRYLVGGWRHTGEHRETWFVIVGPSGARYWEGGVARDEPLTDLQSVGNATYVATTTRGTAAQYSFAFGDLQLERESPPPSQSGDGLPDSTLVLAVALVVLLGVLLGLAVVVLVRRNRE